MSNKIFFSEKYYEYFIDYTDDYKTKPFSVILPNTGQYVNVMTVKLSGCIFRLMLIKTKKSIVIFGINSRVVSKKNLIAEPSTIKR